MLRTLSSVSRSSRSRAENLVFDIEDEVEDDAEDDVLDDEHVVLDVEDVVLEGPRYSRSRTEDLVFDIKDEVEDDVLDVKDVVLYVSDSDIVL
jgi:hypothetical protein